ncbi:hypothetical protein GCM10008941_04690 [Rhizomicrobium palustre]
MLDGGGKAIAPNCYWNDQEGRHGNCGDDLRAMEPSCQSERQDASRRGGGYVVLVEAGDKPRHW